MAKGIYAGTGKLSKLKKIYVGVGGTARKVKQVYVGVAGAVKPVWTLAADGQQIFTTSGTFTVPDGVHKVDIFCVGGGGKGGTSMQHKSYTHVWPGGGGGGGGYTKTMLGVELSQTSYPVIVGASGGISSFGSICDAASGGDGADTSQDSLSGAGGNGGSGGGAGGFYYDEDEVSGTVQPSAGASNGGNASNVTSPILQYTAGGSGQGSTTRAFGETNGTLYSPGSGGKTTTGSAASTGAGVTGANTGAGCSDTTNTYTSGNYNYYETTTGYSGIVIVRWKADDQ